MPEDLEMSLLAVNPDFIGEKLKMRGVTAIVMRKRAGLLLKLFQRSCLHMILFVFNSRRENCMLF